MSAPEYFNQVTSQGNRKTSSNIRDFYDVFSCHEQIVKTNVDKKLKISKYKS